MSMFTVRNLNDGFGAEIEGFEYRGEVDDVTHRRLREVFDERGVLVFRGLDIDRTAQAYLSELMIRVDAPTLEEAAVLAGRQDGFWISNKEPGAAAPFGRLLYHCDMMWSQQPFLVNSLYGLDVAPDVVPTQFVSSVNAWRTLPESLRSRVKNLHALHVTDLDGAGDRRRGDDDGELSNPVRESFVSTTTSVGHRHPRTGCTLLYVSQGMTKEIVELPSDGSEELLGELFAHLYRPENVLEHHWRNGDLILWDNLALQHARPAVSADSPVRTLRKVCSPIPTSAVERESPVYESMA
jgi:taurine dioxygenase